MSPGLAPGTTKVLSRIFLPLSSAFICVTFILKQALCQLKSPDTMFILCLFVNLSQKGHLNTVSQLKSLNECRCFHVGLMPSVNQSVEPEGWNYLGPQESFTADLALGQDSRME